MTDASVPATEASAPRWRPLERNERRVVGVLAEKAKTTPENYPLSINSLISGCNQKSNRYPLMTLDESQVSDALDGLRRAGAVSLIQGDGRVEKHRHLLYDWLGVDKAEMAVMTELLLRGAQTLGELRGRAARMEPIRDVGELQPIVDRLRQKGLVINLTSPGRGGVVTHNLYQPQELTKLRAEHAGAAEDGATPAPGSAGGPPSTPDRPVAPRGDHSPAPARAPSVDSADLEKLRTEVAAVKRDLAELREQTEADANDWRQAINDLKSQLGG